MSGESWSLGGRGVVAVAVSVDLLMAPLVEDLLAAVARERRRKAGVRISKRPLAGVVAVAQLVEEVLDDLREHPCSVSHPSRGPGEGDHEGASDDPGDAAGEQRPRGATTSVADSLGERRQLFVEQRSDRLGGHVT